MPLFGSGPHGGQNFTPPFVSHGDAIVPGHGQDSHECRRDGPPPGGRARRGTTDAACRNGSDLAARHAARRGPLLGGAQSRTAGSGRNTGRTSPGARGGRHRQDTGFDHADRTFVALGARPSGTDPGRDFHQQSRARDEAACQRPDRRSRGRHALARDVSCHRRQNSPAPRRTRRPQVVLHRSRYGRPDSADQAASGGGEHRRQALAGACPRQHDRRLEKSGA